MSWKITHFRPPVSTYSVLILPAFAWQIAIVWAAVVALSATQRMLAGYRLLR